MFKSKKFKAILPALLILIVVALFSFNTNVFSTEETQNEVMPISEETNEIEATDIQEGHNHTSEEPKIEKKDVYLIEESNVTIDYLIDGNLYVISNGTVILTTEVGGNVFILAPTVVIEKEASIYYSAFILAENLTVNGLIYDLYSASTSLTLSETGIIYRDVHSFAETINFAGIIGRNAYFSGNKITLTPGTAEGTNGIIYGNLEYSSPNKIENTDKVVIGETKHTKTSLEGETTSESISTIIIEKLKSLVAYLIFVLAVWGLFKLMKSNYIATSKQLLKTKPLPVLGIGFLTLITVPIISIILLFSSFTVRISAILILAYVIFLFVATSIFAIVLSEILADKFSKLNKFLVLILTIIALFVIGFIPYIGGLVTFASFIFGLGIIVLSLFYRPNTSINEKIEENTENEKEVNIENQTAEAIQDKIEENKLDNLIENLTEEKNNQENIEESTTETNESQNNDNVE